MALGKKRVRNQNAWKRNVAKRKRAEGKKYTNRKGNTVAAKTMGQPCSCRKKCFDSGRQNQYAKVFQEFNELGNKEKQDAYLCGLIRQNAVKRRRSASGNEVRKFQNKYFIRGIKHEIEVCKKAFCSVHGVHKSRIERLSSFLVKKVTAPSDMRGRHANRVNKIPEDVVQNIDSHIKSFPKRSSHYSQNKESKYLPSDLNVRKMYTLYLEKFEPSTFALMAEGNGNPKPTVTYDFYREYFAKNFKLSFGSPRSDTCQTCDSHEKKIAAADSEEERRALKVAKDLHEKKAKAFYDDLREKSCLQDPTVECLTFDFQQNLPLPLIPSGDVFYKRQLWVFNFCIFQCSTKKSYMYMYDETIGKKGPNEVISFLHHFIEHIMSETVRKLYLFSDNCGAQNKNNTLVQYLYAVVKHKNISLIEHHLPEPGHSFLPCDRSFGVIEKQKRRVERLYLPKDWQNLVEKCSNKFKVISVSNENIFDFKTSLAPFYKKTVTNKDHIKWTISKYRRFCYKKEQNVASISASCSHHGPLTKFDIAMKANFQDNPFEPKLLYTTNLALNPKKYDDVMNLAQKYVPPSDIHFYDNLMSQQSIQEAENTDYEDDNEGPL